MTSNDLVEGPDGIWRYSWNGKPASWELHRMLARAEGRGLTAAATQAWATAAGRPPQPKPRTVTGLVAGWRAEAAVGKLREARALVAAEALERFNVRRNRLAHRAERAASALRSIDRQGRNIGIRETANWKKR